MQIEFKCLRLTAMAAERVLPPLKWRLKIGRTFFAKMRDKWWCMFVHFCTRMERFISGCEMSFPYTSRPPGRYADIQEKQWNR